jgi:hypothetical protein
MNHLIALTRDVITKAIGSHLALLKQKYPHNTKRAVLPPFSFSLKLTTHDAQ